MMLLGNLLSTLTTMPHMMFVFKRLGAMKIMKPLILSALLVVVLSSPVLAGFTEGIAAYEAGDLPLAFKEFP